MNDENSLVLPLGTALQPVDPTPLALIAKMLDTLVETKAAPMIHQGNLPAAKK